MKLTLAISAIVTVAALTAFPVAAATATASTKPATAMAAATPAKPAVLTFKLIDSNHDGKISYDELKKYFPKLTKAEFAKADTKNLGYLDHVELAAFYKSMQPAKASTMTPAK